MNEQPASEQIDSIISSLDAWKSKILTDIRKIILSTDPDVVEEVKWKMRTRPQGLPVWSHSGIICIVESFKNDIKLVFFKGALMHKQQKWFNARLNSSKDRAIEYREGDVVNNAVLKEIILEAIKLNTHNKA